MSEQQAQLRRGAIGGVEAIVQSAADVAPAVAVVTSGVFIISLAGLASPLSMLLGTLIALCLAKVMADFARKLPTSGALYTFMTRAFGAKTGFVCGMMLYLSYVLLLLFQLSFFGQFEQQILHTSIPWWLFAAFLILFNTLLAASGVAPSLRIGLIGLAFESIIFLILAVLIVIKGGADGNTLSVFNPSSAPDTSGLLLGIIFGIFVFVGFESATTLGEEMHDPEIHIPRALYWSVGLIGIFVVFVVYSMVIGFGADSAGLEALQNDSVPFHTLAGQYGNGVLQVLVDVATTTSFFALNLVMVIASSRMMFHLSREGLLPARLAGVNKAQTPSVAAWITGAATFAIVCIAGAFWGALNVSNWAAFLSTLFFIAVYVAACVGVVFFYARHYRSELHPVGKVLIPALALVGMGAVLYGNLHPFPEPPLNYFPFATIAVILALIAWARHLEQKDPVRFHEESRAFGGAAPDATASIAVEPQAPISPPSQITDA